MSDSDRIRTLYSIDWTGVNTRAQGLAAAAEVMAEDIQARISPEVGDRVLNGLSEFAVFVEGLEEDFSEFRYDLESVEDNGAGEVVVTGVIRARGRRSKMPLSAPFIHTWTFRDGRGVSVEAHIGSRPGETGTKVA